MKKLQRPAMDIPFTDNDYAPKHKILVVRESAISYNAEKLKDRYSGFFN